MEAESDAVLNAVEIWYPSCLIGTSDGSFVYFKCVTWREWRAWLDDTYPIFMPTAASRERTMVDWSPT